MASAQATCSADDCERPVKARDLCNKHYLREWKAGRLPRIGHGMHGTPEYRAWESVIQRCTNPKHPRYPDWGGRGITVCDAWRESCSALYADMGPRPSGDHSIDRIDNDGNYEPGNCRWATSSEQQRNRRISHR